MGALTGLRGAIRTIRDTMPRSIDMSNGFPPTRASTGHETESTIELLDRARAGDETAVEQLFARYRAPLKRWAHGRLPRWARDLRDTEDLVQESLMQTFQQLHHFQPSKDGALHAYLRRVLKNRLYDELRRVARSRLGPLDTDHPDLSPSPVEEVIGRETLERYETALANLRPDEREAVVARVEMGASYAEIAAALGGRTPDAARMLVNRAIVKLAREMSDAQ